MGVIELEGGGVELEGGGDRVRKVSFREKGGRMVHRLCF